MKGDEGASTVSLRISKNEQWEQSSGGNLVLADMLGVNNTTNYRDMLSCFA